MGQSLSNLLTHIIFSTKNRQPLIRPDIEIRLHGYIRAICRDLESPLLQIGGMEDHIHMLVNQSRKHAVSKFVNEIKSHMRNIYGNEMKSRPFRP